MGRFLSRRSGRLPYEGRWHRRKAVTEAGPPGSAVPDGAQALPPEVRPAQGHVLGVEHPADPTNELDDPAGVGLIVHGPAHPAVLHGEEAKLAGVVPVSPDEPPAREKPGADAALFKVEEGHVYILPPFVGELPDATAAKAQSDGV